MLDVKNLRSSAEKTLTGTSVLGIPRSFYGLQVVTGVDLDIVEDGGTELIGPMMQADQPFSMVFRVFMRRMTGGSCLPGRI